MRLLVLSLLLATLGCGSVQTEYEWVQTEDGIGAKAPIVFTVRLQWVGDTLHVRQKAIDANGLVDLSENKWYDGSSINCEYFDDDNWHCSFVSYGETKPSERIAMSDGVLSWKYWSQDRKPKKKYLIFGKRLFG